MARMCEPRLGILIQGRMRNLELSTTRGRFDASFGEQLLQSPHFRLQGERVLRRAADFLRLLGGLAQFAPACIELPLQRTRPGTGIYLCPAHFFAARFRSARPRPFPLIQRSQVARRACQGCLGGRADIIVTLNQRQVRAKILVANRHALDDSAWPESLPVTTPAPRPLRRGSNGGLCLRRRWHELGTVGVDEAVISVECESTRLPVWPEPCSASVTDGAGFPRPRSRVETSPWFLPAHTATKLGRILAWHAKGEGHSG